MRHNQKGFTLPELLIGLAISSIIIGASFGSYIVIKNNYDFQKDMKNIAQSSRAVATMIMRDVRLAGYNFDDGPGKQNPVITTPVKITDGGSTGPDSIEVIYDQSFTERLKISYYSKPYPNTNSQRSRLYKKVERCDPSVNCSAGSLVTVIPESPIADYIEDFQLTGSKNGNALGTGAVKYGEGNLRWVNPSKISSRCEDMITNVPGSDKDGALTASGAAIYAFDGSHLTSYACKRTNPNALPAGKQNSGGRISLEFSTPVRLTKIEARTVPEIDGGTGPGLTRPDLFNNYQKFTEPYGKYRPVWIELALMYGRSGQQCVNTCEDTGVSGNSCTNSHWNGGKKCVLQSSTRYEGINVWGTTIKDLRNETNSGIDKQAITKLDLYVNNSQVCKYDSGKCTDPGHNDPNGYYEVAEIRFFGEVYGEAQNAQEVEIGLLIRSPEQHGSTPIAQTWNIGNQTINTNDNYIRDAYSISTLVRNLYYVQ